jgi:hypothetical protein
MPGRLHRSFPDPFSRLSVRSDRLHPYGYYYKPRIDKKRHFIFLNAMQKNEIEYEFVTNDTH